MVTLSTTNGGNGNGALSVRALINTRVLSKTKRALLGASVLRGEVDLKPTAKDVARMVGCSVAYLHLAAKLSPAEEQQVRANLRPLAEPKVKGPPAPVSPQDRLSEIVSEVGVNNTLVMLSAIERGAAAV
jgi:hypothetical protein